MDDKFEITEAPIALTGLPESFDIKQAIGDFYVRYSKLEDQLANERENANKEMKRFILSVLEVADALDRILERQAQAEGSDERLLKSIESTRRLMSQKLSKIGVQQIDLVGEILNPELGDIEDTESNPEIAPETVLAEIVKGYRWNELILRRAKVIVSS